MKESWHMFVRLVRKIHSPVKSAMRLLLLSLDDIFLPKRNLTICIGNNEISVAYGFKVFFFCRSRGLASIELADACDARSAVNAVRDATEKLKKYRREVILGIPPEWALIETTVFPEVMKPNLADAVSQEFDRLTPFTSGNACYDFVVLEETGPWIKIVLQAVNRQKVEAFTKEFAQAGLAVKEICLTSSGIASLIGLRSGRPNFIFMVPDVQGYITGSVHNRVLTCSHHRGEGAADEVVPFPADLSASDVFVIAARGHMELGPEKKAVFIDPGSIIKEKEMQTALMYAALGLTKDALSTGSHCQDLLMRGIHHPAGWSKALTCVLLGIFIASGAAYYIVPLIMKTNKVREIERQIKAHESEVKKVRALQRDIRSLEKEIGTINNFRGSRPSPINTLKELTTIIPKPSWLTEVKISEKDIVIGGYAPDPSTLLSRMTAMSSYHKPQFPSSVRRDSRTGLSHFSIQMEQKGIEEKKDDPAKKK
jgi:hypothetical protein